MLRSAYLDRCGLDEGLGWANGGLRSRRSHHLRMRSRKKKKGSELGGAGSEAKNCGSGRRPRLGLGSARCGTGARPAGCSRTNSQRLSSAGPGSLLLWRMETVAPCSTFSSSPCLDSRLGLLSDGRLSLPAQIRKKKSVYIAATVACSVIKPQMESSVDL